MLAILKNLIGQMNSLQSKILSIVQQHGLCKSETENFYDVSCYIETLNQLKLRICFS